MKNTKDSHPTSQPPLAAAPCSAFRFAFSATHPKGSARCGGTFLEGDLEIDDPSDLPEAALEIFKGAVKEWELDGLMEIRFSVLPNASAQLRREQPKNLTSTKTDTQPGPRR